ncbi:MAG TPA: carbonic anhydrase [Streptosporangiaceae bacterium]|nr:carbonic anhydrase [Streptosporangiaceae bacterium]
MGVVKDLTERNAQFAKTHFSPGLRMRPTLATIVICCVDTRVDPTVVLGAEQGEIMAIRNVGGRITPHTLDELIMLRQVSQSAGNDFSEWELIIMQHTQCGITRIQDHPELLASYFEIGEKDLPGTWVADPQAAVVRDAAVLRGETRLDGARVSGLVYDVATGLVETIVHP